MEHTLIVWTVLAVLLLTATAQNTEDNSGGCVSQQQLAEVRRELQSRVDWLQGQLSYWQNTTLTVIKDHVITGSATQCSVEYPDSMFSNITQNTQQIFMQLQQLAEQLRQVQVVLHTYMGTRQNPAPSCEHIHQAHPNSSSGDYWIQTGPGSAVQVYCDMDRVCGCGGTSGWMRVADLDMTRQGEECPVGFRLSSSSGKRLCGGTGRGCVSTSFSSRGMEYSRVCGKVIGYQYGSTDAFWPYYNSRTLTLNDYFLDGVVLTHGSPRNHIWSFAAGYSQTHTYPNRCPCASADGSFRGTVPPFIGNDYFCDSGSRYTPAANLHVADPLWDGEGCVESNTCCEFNSPPWFCKDLPSPTTDDIELRICANEALSNEDTLIETVDIYVQ